MSTCYRYIRFPSVFDDCCEGQTWAQEDKDSIYTVNFYTCNGAYSIHLYREDGSCMRGYQSGGEEMLCEHRMCLWMVPASGGRWRRRCKERKSRGWPDLSDGKLTGSLFCLTGHDVARFLEMTLRDVR